MDARQADRDARNAILVSEFNQTLQKMSDNTSKLVFDIHRSLNDTILQMSKDSSVKEMELSKTLASKEVQLSKDRDTRDLQVKVLDAMIKVNEVKKKNKDVFGIDAGPGMTFNLNRI